MDHDLDLVAVERVRRGARSATCVNTALRTGNVEGVSSLSSFGQHAAETAGIEHEARLDFVLARRRIGAHALAAVAPLAAIDSGHAHFVADLDALLLRLVGQQLVEVRALHLERGIAAGVNLSPKSNSPYSSPRMNAAPFLY